MLGGTGNVRRSPDEFARRLDAARNGCPHALGDLLQGCRRFLLMIANKELESTLRPKQGASDLVQESFLLATSDFNAFRGTSQHELTEWLHSILKRRLQTQTRSFRQTASRTVKCEVKSSDAHAVASAVPDPRQSPEDAAERADESNRLHVALQRLPKDYQRVLTLRIWQRLSFAEIGQQLERSTAAAEKLWVRAIRRLRTEMKRVQ